MSKPTAIVYVDGFNLYRRALKGTPYKWLDIDALVSMLLADYEVIQIRYFTANIKSLPHNPMQAHRQQIYLRALATNPKIIIHKGKFRTDPRVMPFYPWEFDENGNPKMVKIRKTEEKGSDVNLATYFLFDIFTDKADAYVVLTNDSDLAEPIRLARHELGQTIGLILPTDTPSKDLLRIDLQIVRQIREGVLIASQLPDVFIDKHGTIQKPEAW
ncbi:MAG: NYN domain-containing protein [Candidatus Nanopelagicaceae bacterium]|nr:NYN domain-containing protein [Candidatus Nanopelagicaceae bacterium]